VGSNSQITSRVRRSCRIAHQGSCGNEVEVIQSIVRDLDQLKQPPVRNPSFISLRTVMQEKARKTFCLTRIEDQNKKGSPNAGLPFLQNVLFVMFLCHMSGALYAFLINSAGAWSCPHMSSCDLSFFSRYNALIRASMTPHERSSRCQSEINPVGLAGLNF